MTSLPPAYINLEGLKAAPRQGQSMIMFQFIKTTLWTFALSFLVIVMVVWLIPCEPPLSDPLICRSGWMP